MASIEVGDDVRLHPDVGLVVAEVEPGRVLVLRGGVPIGRAPAPYDFTWAFVVRDGLDGTIRLVVREPQSYARWWSGLLVEPVELVSAVMSQRMLRGIRDRAEGARSTPSGRVEADIDGVRRRPARLRERGVTVRPFPSSRRLVTAAVRAGAASCRCTGCPLRADAWAVAVL